MTTEPAPRHLGMLPLFALLLGGFITVFDLFVVNVALPFRLSLVDGMRAASRRWRKPCGQ
ncbi:hypothetical protein RPE78_02210 [Thioclava litoralis]|uniref:Uncharacterized protein n=1 Tax=Thioclava litoralis TaxID=3076557 RepID=A0ABZ1E4R7_9RHOB|nr:hypothetical protein RPE78_02210 [Thioclava sp. FTW29]